MKGEERQDAVFTFTAEQIKDALQTRLARLEKVIARKQEDGEATRFERIAQAQLVWLLKAQVRGGTFTYHEATSLLGDLR